MMYLPFVDSVLSSSCFSLIAIMLCRQATYLILLDRHGKLYDLLNDEACRRDDALPQLHRVHSRRDETQALVHDLLGQQRRRCGSVTCPAWRWHTRETEGGEGIKNRVSTTSTSVKTRYEKKGRRELGARGMRGKVTRICAHKYQVYKIPS